MRRFKLRQGEGKVYELTKEIYEEVTKEKEGYTEIGKDRVKRSFAICPGCDNPIQIIGLYKKLENTDRPYGKHYNHDCKLAPHREQAYRFCPYASFKYEVTKDSKKDEVTEYEKSIYNTLRENIDLAVYIIQQDTGILFSKKVIAHMLEEYKASEGYMYYWATIYNIPWMLLHFTRAQKIWGMYVKKSSPLYQKLKERKDVLLQPVSFSPEYEIVKNRGRSFLNLEFSTYAHKRKIVDDEVIETLKMDFFSSFENELQTQFVLPLTINEYRFPNLINSLEAQKYRRPELIQLAKEILPELA